MLRSAERIRHLPVYTFASGPTNSMRGAAFLSGTKDAIVIDIGGTTTDVGLIKGGFPKQASTRIKVKQNLGYALNSGQLVIVGPKGLRNAFYGCENSKNVLVRGLVIS